MERFVGNDPFGEKIDATKWRINRIHTMFALVTNQRNFFQSLVWITGTWFFVTRTIHQINPTSREKKISKKQISRRLHWKFGRDSLNPTLEICWQWNGTTERPISSIRNFMNWKSCLKVSEHVSLLTRRAIYTNRWMQINGVNMYVLQMR